MPRILAIDPGAWSIKVLALTGQGNEWELDGVARVRVPQDGAAVSTMPDRLASLRSLLRSQPELTAGGHVTVSAWPASKVSARRLKLPFEDPEQIAATLPFTVEAEVPFDLDDMVLAWGSRPGSGNVVVELTRRAPLSSYIDGLVEQALDPKAICSDGDVVAWWATGREGVVAFVDVGHEHTTVTVAHHGQSLWWRSVSIAGRDVTAAIARVLGCSWHDAERLKHGDDELEELPLAVVEEVEDGPAAEGEPEHNGPMLLDPEPDEDDEALNAALGDALDASDDPDTEATQAVEAPAPEPTFVYPADGKLPAEAQSAVDAVMGHFLAQVRATLVEAEELLSVDIDEVLLSGGGSRLRGLREHLSEDLGLPVDVITRSDGVAPEPMLGVVEALAFSQALSAERYVNLRVGDLAYKGGLDLQRAVFTYGGAGLGVFLAAVLLLFTFQYRQLVNERYGVDERLRDLITEALGELPSGMESGSLVAALAGEVGELETQVRFLGDGSGTPETIDLLYRISEALPPYTDVTLVVESLDIQPAAITMQGSTDGFAQIDSITASLDESGHFAAVNAVPGDRNQQGKLNFSLTIERSDAPNEDEG